MAPAAMPMSGPCVRMKLGRHRHLEAGGLEGCRSWLAWRIPDAPWLLLCRGLVAWPATCGVEDSALQSMKTAGKLSDCRRHGLCLLWLDLWVGLDGRCCCLLEVGSPTDSHPRGGISAGWVLLAANKADFATRLDDNGGDPPRIAEGGPRGIRTLTNNVLRTNGSVPTWASPGAPGYYWVVACL